MSRCSLTCTWSVASSASASDSGSTSPRVDLTSASSADTLRSVSSRSAAEAGALSSSEPLDDLRLDAATAAAASTAEEEDAAAVEAAGAVCCCSIAIVFFCVVSTAVDSVMLISGESSAQQRTAKIRSARRSEVWQL